MVLIVGILVIWLTVLTVAVMILAAQVNNRAHAVAEERAAAAGMLELVRDEVQGIVDVLERGEREAALPDAERVLMYTDALAQFWQRRSTETATSQEHTPEPVPADAPASAAVAHAVHRDRQPSQTLQRRA